MATKGYRFVAPVTVMGEPRAPEPASLSHEPRTALDEARTADQKGDAKGCEAALARAKQELSASP